jgi:hypothetical protein
MVYVLQTGDAILWMLENGRESEWRFQPSQCELVYAVREHVHCLLHFLGRTGPRFIPRCAGNSAFLGVLGSLHSRVDEGGEV